MVKKGMAVCKTFLLPTPPPPPRSHCVLDPDETIYERGRGRPPAAESSAIHLLLSIRWGQGPELLLFRPNQAAEGRMWTGAPPPTKKKIIGRTRGQGGKT